MTRSLKKVICVPIASNYLVTCTIVLWPSAATNPVTNHFAQSMTMFYAWGSESLTSISLVSSCPATNGLRPLFSGKSFFYFYLLISNVLFYSITLGGFGSDRFYLGNWQEGIGKLFSFGGLGIWTLIDVILIFTGYLKPHDGSVYA